MMMMMMMMMMTTMICRLRRMLHAGCRCSTARTNRVFFPVTDFNLRVIYARGGGLLAASRLNCFIQSVVAVTCADCGVLTSV